MTFFRPLVLAVALFIPLGAHAADLRQTVDKLESRLGARIGVAIHNTGSGVSWTHRPNERFLTNSTIKVPLCAAVLARDDLDLSEQLPVKAEDIVEYAPVTAPRVGGTMSISELCFATIDQSDNTAANILFNRLGGPDELTAFLRGVGDKVTRSDRLEPELNVFAANDLRDTTSPAAMVATLQTLLVGDALQPEDRKQLTDWMSVGGVTRSLIRPFVPAGWAVADKSGGGDKTRNLIAMLTPPDGAPIFVSLSISDTSADFTTRNEALIELCAAVMEMLVKQ